ncbi:tautomerase family protein [Caballeronia sp. M23-90]
MPFLRFDVVEGRSDSELASLMDAGHQAVLSAFEVPAGDRYQVVHEHKKSNLIFEDTGLRIARTSNVVFVSVTTRPRPEAQKQKFYVDLCSELESRCGIKSSDVIVSITINSDADWSFGLGRAQFLTGEL